MFGINIAVGCLAAAYGVALCLSKHIKNGAIMIFLGLANVAVGVLGCVSR